MCEAHAASTLSGAEDLLDSSAYLLADIVAGHYWITWIDAKFGSNVTARTIFRKCQLEPHCSGLMYPDTNLGENARHGEVFDEQAKTYIFP